jgi:mycothiol synthase
MLDMLTHPARGGTGTAKLFWAHGNHEAARALARHHGLETVRTLLQLVVDVPASGDLPVVDGVTVSGFAETDADTWFQLHGQAFVGHPERGDITRDQFEAMCAEDWFNAEDLLMLRDGETLIGYCWLRIMPAITAGEATEAEVFVAGVHPDRQGAGLGHLLVHAGMARLREQGIQSAHVYVESDNAPALRLCREFGFTERSVDVQYHYSR